MCGHFLLLYSLRCCQHWSILILTSWWPVVLYCTQLFYNSFYMAHILCESFITMNNNSSYGEKKNRTRWKMWRERERERERLSHIESCWVKQHNSNINKNQERKKKQKKATTMQQYAIWKYGTSDVEEVQNKFNCPFNMHAYMHFICLALNISFLLIPPNDSQSY